MSTDIRFIASQNYFKDNSYCYFNEVLDKNTCADLVEHMFTLHSLGKTSRDPQCPLSDSIYGDEKFDAILQAIAEPLSLQLGIDLVPTYTYARIYRPGEVLKIHRDREACEISGTLTLGISGDDFPWPIFMGKTEDERSGKRFDIFVGDLVMYRGCDVYHWRPEFKGTWQCQVFFHFVDKNGVNAHHAFDGRKSLGTKKAIPVAANPVVVTPKFEMKYAPIFNAVAIPSQTDDIVPGFVQITDQFLPELKFTAAECESLIRIAKSSYPNAGATGKDGKVDKKVRDVEVYDIPIDTNTQSTYEKIAFIISKVNTEYYQFDLSSIQNALQLLHYKHTPDSDGHYDWHVDFGPGPMSTRKLSISIQLSDENKYEGGELEINDHGGIKTARKEKGAVSIFPSYLLHRVAPITQGERWALVIWVHGYRRFK